MSIGVVAYREIIFEMPDKKEILLTLVCHHRFEPAVHLLLAPDQIDSLSDDEIVQIHRGYSNKYGTLVACVDAMEEREREDQFAAHEAKRLREYRERQRTPIPLEDRGKPGHMYIIEALIDGLPVYKIGITHGKVETRTNAIIKQLPMRASLLGHIACEKTAGTEYGIHQKFESQRIKGEWFKLAPNDIGWIMKQGDRQNG